MIDIATRQPGPRAHASFEAGAESRYGYHVTGTADGSLIKDWLYGSIALTSQEQQGNVSNPSTGSRRLGGFESRGGRATLRLAPTDQPGSLPLLLMAPVVTGAGCLCGLQPFAGS